MPKPTRYGYSETTIHHTNGRGTLRYCGDKFRSCEVRDAAVKTPSQRLSYMSCRLLAYMDLRPCPSACPSLSCGASAVRKRLCNHTLFPTWQKKCRHGWSVPARRLTERQSGCLICLISPAFQQGMGLCGKCLRLPVTTKAPSFDSATS